MENNTRAKAHQKSDDLEQILKILNHQLSHISIDTDHSFENDEHNNIFIVGAPRSGSTLLYQYCASSGAFSYPTNFISRFYSAPYIGALAQKALLDLDVKKEVFQQDAQFDFTSKLGKTTGPKAPNEFWYFWRRYFDFSDYCPISIEKIKQVNFNHLNREINQFKSVFQLPLVMKAMHLNGNLSAILERMPNTKFLFPKRDVISNAYSLYNARINYFGDATQWYSFKPSSYESIKHLSPEKQVVHQVIDINAEIEQQLESIDSANHIKVDYQSFCKNPNQLYDQMVAKNWIHNSSKPNSIPSFRVSKHRSINDDAFLAIESYAKSLKTFDN